MKEREKERERERETVCLYIYMLERVMTVNTQIIFSDFGGEIKLTGRNFILTTIPRRRKYIIKKREDEKKCVYTIDSWLNGLDIQTDLSE